jgi:hypothetical protein
VVSTLWYWVTGLGATWQQYSNAMIFMVLVAINGGMLGNLISLVTRDINISFPGAWALSTCGGGSTQVATRGIAPFLRRC